MSYYYVICALEINKQKNINYERIKISGSVSNLYWSSSTRCSNFDRKSEKHVFVDRIGADSRRFLRPYRFEQENRIEKN